MVGGGGKDITSLWRVMRITPGPYPLRDRDLGRRDSRDVDEEETESGRVRSKVYSEKVITEGTEGHVGE